MNELLYFSQLFESYFGCFMSDLFDPVGDVE